MSDPLLGEEMAAFWMWQGDTNVHPMTCGIHSSESLVLPPFGPMLMVCPRSECDYTQGGPLPEPLLGRFLEAALRAVIDRIDTLGIGDTDEQRPNSVLCGECGGSGPPSESRWHRHDCSTWGG